MTNRTIPYLIRRNHCFFFRIGVPADLRLALQCREITKSLKTETKEQAAPLALILAANAKRLFAVTRANMAIQTDPVHSADQAQLEIIEDGTPSNEALSFDKLRQNARIALERIKVDETRQQLEEQSYQHRKEILALQAKHREEAQTVKALAEKDAEILAHKLAASIATTPTKPKDTRTIHDIFERWKIKTDTPSDSSIKAFATCIKKFDALYPNLPISEIESEHFERFTQQLRSKKLADNTVRKTVMNLKTLVNYANDVMKLETPELGKVTTPKKSKKTSRRSYTPEELNLIFQSPLFTNTEEFTQSDELKQLFRNKSGITAKDLAAPSSFWIPLIMCFTGARREEVCQLSTDRIIEKHGVLCFEIDTLDENDSLKTENSYRLIPVSSRLLQIGFAEFVEKQRKAGHHMLFNQLRGKGGKFGAKYGEAWSVYLREYVGLTDPNAAPAHSFRHLFTQEVRGLMRPSDIQDCLTGHIDQSRVSTQYGEMHLIKQMQSYIDGCKFEDVDFSHLYS